MKYNRSPENQQIPQATQEREKRKRTITVITEDGDEVVIDIEKIENNEQKFEASKMIFNETLKGIHNFEINFQKLLIQLHEELKSLQLIQSKSELQNKIDQMLDKDILALFYKISDLTNFKVAQANKFHRLPYLDKPENKK